jgi:hypothetical protein
MTRWLPPCGGLGWWLRMPSTALATFLRSVNEYGWYQYREGEGYDLAALRQVPDEERARVIELMEAVADPDWIHVEVLDLIGTARCLEILRRWTELGRVVCRMCSLSALHRRKQVDEAFAEAVVLRALGEMTIVNGMTHVLEWAKVLPTPRVKRMVLWCSLHGHEDVRVHCAALAHHLYGVVDTDFDWSQRPLYLQFNDAKTAGPAYERLCRDVQDVGVRFP